MALSSRIKSALDASFPKPGNYVITEKLGAGTYATVFKAFNKLPPREAVAIKCILKSSLNKISMENLLTEIELLKTLRHEYIVELKDFEWDDTYVYLIMEYCSGGDLRHYIHSQKCLPERTVRRFLQQLATALQYMREKNVSHMDLKPQNILLSSQEHPVLKVADFGFAHYLVDRTKVEFLRGSPLYMAPEIVCERQYSAKADLWSVGIILYECIFGRAPFASPTLEEVVSKIKDKSCVELPNHVPVTENCRDLLTKLLQRDPERRITFDAFFAHPFLDLEHMPSSKSLPQAIELVKIAVGKDAKGNILEAIEFYCSALEHFLAAVAYEKNEGTKFTLRSKIQQYILRAEMLKQIVNNSSLKRDNSPEASLYQELVTLSAGNVQLTDALDALDKAQREQSRNNLQVALEGYHKCLDIFIKVSQGLSAGRLKEVLLPMIHQWMTEAESLQKHLKLIDLSSQVKDIEDAASIGNRESRNAGVGESTCSIQ